MEESCLFPPTPPESSNSVSGPALFTINNDGTEITAFAGPEDSASAIQQPRLLADGRVVFLVSKSGSSVRRNLFAWPGRFKAARRCFPV